MLYGHWALQLQLEPSTLLVLMIMDVTKCSNFNKATPAANDYQGTRLRVPSLPYLSSLPQPISTSHIILHKFGCDLYMNGQR